MLCRTLEAMHHNVVLRDIGLVRFDENHVLLIQFEDILVARQNHPQSTPDSTPREALGLSRAKFEYRHVGATGRWPTGRHDLIESANIIFVS